MRSALFLVLALVGCTRTSSDPQTAGATVPAVQAPELHPPGDDGCDDSLRRTFDELEAADGTQLAIDGVPQVGVVCTERECTDGRACCNHCEGEYALIDDGRQVNLRGLPGCSGMDCNTVCEPFGRKPTDRYRFVGRYDHAQRTLQVEKFCRR